MSINQIWLTCALALLVPLTSARASAQQSPAPQGFEAVAADPFSAGLFQTVNVVGGDAVRAIARNLEGRTDTRPYVNVLRWVDARPFRSKILSIKQRAQLQKPAPDTQASLWVRVVRADGSVGFADHGRDQATSSSEWTTLESIGAIAADATDLYFGLLVEGTTPVNIGEFSLEVRGNAAANDVRLSVPNRWIRDPSVLSTRISDSDGWFQARRINRSPTSEPTIGVFTKGETDQRVTSFRPDGYTPGELPSVWFVRDEADLRRSFDQGRALLAAMRAGREPAAIINFVEPLIVAHAAMDIYGISKRILHSHLAPSIGLSTAEGTTHVLIGSRDGELATPLPQMAKDLDSARARSLLVDSTAFNVERVSLRWATAVHAAHAMGDPTLTELLFDAAIESMELWQDTPLVRQASHSMAGHSHTHVHADGTTHTHSF